MKMNGMEIMNRIVEYINAYVWLGIPVVLKGIIIALVFVILFRKILKEHPVAFYIYPAAYLLLGIVCGVGSVASILSDSGSDESWFAGIAELLDLFDELGLSTAFGIGLIVIVMFIGVLPKATFITNLFAIRTEMSIIGATLLMGHAIFKFDRAIYWIIQSDYSQALFWMYSVLGPVLLVLLVLPWITSFRTVRKKMSGRTWKKLQTYLGVPLFIVMLVVGLGLNLAWSVRFFPNFVDMGEITVSGDNPISLGRGISFAEYLLAVKIYLALLISYSILRIRKVRKGNRSTAALSAETSKATV
jgi:DMSO/TMAO reductase YedYZ heme-binding membrane subunit